MMKNHGHNLLNNMLLFFFIIFSILAYSSMARAIDWIYVNSKGQNIPNYYFPCTIWEKNYCTDCTNCIAWRICYSPIDGPIKTYSSFVLLLQDFKNTSCGWGFYDSYPEGKKIFQLIHGQDSFF